MIHLEIKALSETLELNNKQIEELTNDIDNIINSMANVPKWKSTIFLRLISGIEPYYIELRISSEFGIGSIESFKPYFSIEDYTTAMNKEKEQ